MIHVTLNVFRDLETWYDATFMVHFFINGFMKDFLAKTLCVGITLPNYSSGKL